MGQIFALELADQRPVTALADVENGVVREVVHEPHTTRAEDAAVGDVNHVAAEILRRVEALRLTIARVLAPFLVGVILELALAGLVANRTVERVIDEQHLEHALSRLEWFLVVNVDDLSFRDRRCAGGSELGSLLDVDQTHAADARDRKAGMIAVVRNQNANLLGRLEDSGSLGYRNLTPFDRQGDHLRLHRSRHATASITET